MDPQRHQGTPAEAWVALAPLLAGQLRVRLSRDGKSYPQKHERPLTETLPTFPAAVRIFGKDGTCAAIFLDFDSSVAGVDWVEADVRAVQDWLYRCGARWIEDYSPNGGRHVYIPLEQRVTFSEARDLVEALGARYRSLDKTPHQNLLHGCMRTPGSPHKRGGHQELAMSLNMAHDVARRPNTAAVWAAINADLAGEIAAVRALRLEGTIKPAAGAPQIQHPVGRMSRTMQLIAQTGLYDTNRYTSDSEARQAVITAAAAAGLDLLGVERRMMQGTWPGLASFYARYASQNRVPALRRDWQKAVNYLSKKPETKAGKNNARISPTSQPNTQGGAPAGLPRFSKSDDDVNRNIRTWWNAARLREFSYAGSRTGLCKRMVLRAMGEAAHKTGSLSIEFGVRSIAVATGLDHTTVGSHLRALRSEKDPLVTLVEKGRGTKGDLYRLTVPDDLKAAAEDLTWRKGKIHALRPVFRELGLPAAFVYETLEHSSGLSTTEIVKLTRLSRTAVSEALEAMAAWNMISRGKERAWSVVMSTSLKDLAERFGVLEAVATQLQRYRIERILWKEWLSKNVRTVAELLSPCEDYPWEAFEGPPDDWTLSDMALYRGRSKPGFIL